MRYVTFSAGGHHRRPGILDGSAIRPFGDAVASLDAFIAAGEAERAAAVQAAGAPVPLAEATLHAPVRPRKNVFCVGRNYLAHAQEGADARGESLKLDPYPTIFTKAPTAIADPGADLRLQGDVSPQYDWEAELAVVIGRSCKDVPEASALDVVFGYTCLNDVTARDLQKATTQWFKGKSLDDTCPIGPWIVDAAEFGDPQAVEVSLRLNGEVKQHAPTSQMIYKVANVIAYLSRGMTLEPGDVIATGTPEGVGFARKPPEFLKDGDVMEVEVSKIGVLRNTVRIAVPAAVR